MFPGAITLVILIVAILFSAFKILNEYERGVVLTLGLSLIHI